MPIDPSTIKWDDKPAIDPGSIKWDDAPKESTYLDRLKGNTKALAGEVKDTAAGLVRGAGSIGATLLAPNDALARKTGLRLTGNVMSPLAPAGDDPGDRRQAMDDTFSGMGVDTKAGGYQGGKILAEIAGTSGVGKGLGLAAEGVGAVPELVNALRTGGYSVGPTAFSAAEKLATRALGGFVTGGATVGLADPNHAGSAAILGMGLPGVTTAAGKLGGALRGTPLTAAQQASVDTARQAGYKLPPTEINPNALNSIAEGLSGKIKTSQAASQKNQTVTNALATKALDLPEGTQLSHEVLNDVRKKAGMAYEAVGATGTVTPGPEYAQALEKITEKARSAAAGFPDAAPDPLIKAIDGLKSKQFDAKSAVDKISDLRAQADKAYRAGDHELGKGLKAGAGALEDALDAHLKQLGVPPEMLQGFRDARKTIAKTYSVQKGLNNETGNVSASALARQLERGKPLSGELETIGKVGSAFPKATQTLKQNYNALSPLDFAAGMAMHGVGGHLAIPLVRPAVRGAILSDVGQNIAAKGPVLNALAGPAVYRALPRSSQRN